MIYQLVLQLAGGGLKSFAVDKECAAAIRDAEDCLSSGEAVSAVLQDRGGLSVWSGTKALA